MTTTATNTATDATEGPALDASATDSDEQPAAGAGTPEDREDSAEGENGGDEGDSAPRGRVAAARQRAQEAEAARDAAEARATDLAGTVKLLQRLHVEQAVTAAGVKPAAVFAVAELADLIDDTGLPDADKVKAAVATAREQLGVSRPVVERQMGMRSGAGVAPPKRDGWAAAFGPRSE
jgi:hypothetical protein